MPFRSSSDVYEWISRFINIERGQSHRSFRLDRMQALAEMAGRPETKAPSFHVAGTKGKGSVTGMIAAILEALGMKTARYASPHVVDFRERLCMGNKFFDEDTYIRTGTEMKRIVDALHASPQAELFDPRYESGEEPTFFELMTLWFFLCARHARCDAMAVEVGMGGRLDSTNIIDPHVSVITIIELEHTEYLGNTIAAIAGEKAGIIKPGRPLVLAEQNPEALEVFRERAKENKSPLLYFPDYAEIRNVRVNRDGTSFDLVLKTGAGPDGKTGDETFSNLFVPIPGEVQAKNAGLAVLALKTAFPDINEKSIRAGLAAFTLPARFERISETPALVIDGAHTKRSVEICVKTFTGLYGPGGILIFGCAAGKDVLSMAELCVPNFSRIIITTPGSYKKSFPEEIYAVFNREAQKASNKPVVLFVPDTEEAIDRAANLAFKYHFPILGTGSFYLAGEIKSRLRQVTRQFN